MNGQMDQPRGLMPEGGAGQPASAPAPQEGGDETANVSPEEQAQYDQFVNNGLELIYNEKSFPKVVEALKVGNDPIDAVVNATVNIVQRLQDSAKQKNVPLSPDVIFQGGVEILEDLANLCEKAGIHSFTEKDLEAATYRAMDLYRDNATAKGELHPEQFQQDFEQMKQMNETGELDKEFPDIKQHFANEQQQPDEQQQAQPGPGRGLMPGGGV